VSSGSGLHTSVPHHLVADEPPLDDVDDRHVTEGDAVRAGGRCGAHQSQSAKRRGFREASLLLLIARLIWALRASILKSTARNDGYIYN
jgi:hypothetical protein